MFSLDFIPQKPFPGFKWKWASLQCTEGLNDPVVLLGVLFRMRKLELTGKSYKYSSPEFAHEMRELSKDIKCSVEGSDKIKLSERTGERNFMRNSGQYWRTVGLLADGKKGVISLSEFGRKIADREISQTEFAAQTIQTLNLPNQKIQSKQEVNLWKSHSLRIYPLRLLLEILRALRQCHGEKQGFITPFELTKIVIPLSGSTTKINDYAVFIMCHRKNKLSLSKWPNCVPAANDFRIAREFLLFLSHYGYVNCIEGDDRQNEKYVYNDGLDVEIGALLAIPPHDTSIDSIRATTSDIERKRVASSRPNQAKFRKAILQEFDRCIVTNVTMPEILEAAHIKPVKYKGEDSVANGLALRVDIHLLFDSGHLRISETGKIELSARARNDYGATIPPQIVLPERTNPDFLRWRWENYDGI
jgi:Predicted restriction endonuclease